MLCEVEELNNETEYVLKGGRVEEEEEEDQERLAVRIVEPGGEEQSRERGLDRMKDN